MRNYGRGEVCNMMKKAGRERKRKRKKKKNRQTKNRWKLTEKYEEIDRNE